MSDETMQFSADDAAELVARLDRQRELYADLLDLSSRQVRIIEGEGGAERLLEVLGRKQVLINRLAELEQEMRPLKKSWQQSGGSLESPGRLEIAQSVCGLQSTLAELLALEERSRAVLEARQGEVATRLRGLEQCRKAQCAYGSGKA